MNSKVIIQNCFSKTPKKDRLQVVQVWHEKLVTLNCKYLRNDIKGEEVTENNKKILVNNLPF